MRLYDGSDLVRTLNHLPNCKGISHEPAGNILLRSEPTAERPTFIDFLPPQISPKSARRQDILKTVMEIFDFASFDSKEPLIIRELVISKQEEFSPIHQGNVFATDLWMQGVGDSLFDGINVVRFRRRLCFQHPAANPKNA